MDITSLSNHKLPKISSYYNVKLTLLVNKYFGYWPSLNVNQRFYAIYTFFSFSLTIGAILLAELVYVIVYIRDFNKLTSISLLLFTNVVHVSKIQNLIRKRKQIRHLLEYVETGQFSNETDKYERIVTYFSWFGLFHYAINVLFGMGAITGWSIISLFSVDNDKIDRRLPSDGWFPYDPLKSPAFELTCVYEIIILHVCAFHNLALDHLTVGFMSVVCCQFVILNCNLQSIGDDVLNAENIKNDLSNSLKNKENDDLIYKRLVKCVEDHMTIIQFAKDVENIFNLPVFLQFLESCLVICVTAYQISQSESVVQAAFSGNWWKSSERYKRALRLMMVRAGRPLTITTGNLLTLSLSTFMGILKASYSFFTVLQSTNKKI
ncbi:putative odorant receptor 85d isoform X2 [Cephus cinctus]|uniref:Odorant receptor n=1 Tax=Cephus cinctus TaxID=211228 RepID=A0AAJ7RH63_CEPCN|nr:putative odorant receptor 85d isoform X2 [Cephus cinctus]